MMDQKDAESFARFEKWITGLGFKLIRRGGGFIQTWSLWQYLDRDAGHYWYVKRFREGGCLITIQDRGQKASTNTDDGGEGSDLASLIETLHGKTIEDLEAYFTAMNRLLK